MESKQWMFLLDRTTFDLTPVCYVMVHQCSLWFYFFFYSRIAYSSLTSLAFMMSLLWWCCILRTTLKVHHVLAVFPHLSSDVKMLTPVPSAWSGAGECWGSQDHPLGHRLHRRRRAPGWHAGQAAGCYQPSEHPVCHQEADWTPLWRPRGPERPVRASPFALNCIIQSENAVYECCRETATQQNVSIRP